MPKDVLKTAASRASLERCVADRAIVVRINDLKERKFCIGLNNFDATPFPQVFPVLCDDGACCACRSCIPQQDDWDTREPRRDACSQELSHESLQARRPRVFGDPAVPQIQGADWHRDLHERTVRCGRRQRTGATIGLSFSALVLLKLSSVLSERCHNTRQRVFSFSQEERIAHHAKVGDRPPFFNRVHVSKKSTFES